MRLVIAEKPSVARAIAGAVGAKSKGDGYIEGAGYVVTWCHGHLVDLAEPGDYEQWEGPWDLAKLPMIPERWLWRPAADEGAARQLRVIADLMARADVDEVVNACDADREGEGIFRRVYEHLGCSKPVLRLWSTSLVDEAIRKDLARMRPGSDYDGLGDAAEGRAKADWLVGMNGTRAYTLVYDARPPLSVGRVQTPVLAMVAARTLEARGFKPKPFWRVIAHLDGFAVESERFDAREEADALLADVLAHPRATVVSVERKDAAAKPPLLYDLTSLQRDASTRAGLTADETLAALQSLYERKLATYPRTDSRYITADDADGAAALIPRIASPGIVGEAAAGAFDPSRADIARVVNDGKVSGHGAVLPTGELDEAAMEGLSGAERAVMLLVCCRLLAAVMEPGMRAHAKAVIKIAGLDFSASGTSVKDASWMAVDDACRRALKDLGGEDGAEPASGVVPENLFEGDELKVGDAEVREGKTAAPKPYTDATLLSAMENAGRDIEDAELKAAIADDSSHSGGLGTPATRADTIERIISKGFAERKGRSILATDKGIQLVETVADGLKSPLLTAEWEARLAAIERDGAAIGEFIADIGAYAREVVAEARESFDPARFSAASIGKCPLCGGAVVPTRSGKGWHCANQRSVKDGDGWKEAGSCAFRIGYVAGKLLTEKQARSLLSGGTAAVKGMRKRAGGTFDAKCVLDPDGRVSFVREKRRSGNNRNSGRKG